MSSAWSEGSVRLKDNSLAHSSSGLVSMDDRLTSLQWIQDFSININRGKAMPLSAQNQGHLRGHQQMAGSEAAKSPIAADPAPTVDYKTNPNIKPPYSYATLICMAMQANKNTKITLSYIYEWIRNNFCYFRHADPNWQNSIRHSLSVNKCFIKVPRQKDEPGKRGFWTIDPQYTNQLLCDAYKKTRMPSMKMNPTLKAWVRPAPLTHMGFLPAIEGALSVSPESQQLLQEFEQATAVDLNQDPSGAKRAGSRSRKRCVHKRKRMNQDRATPPKSSRRCSSPLPSTVELEGLDPLKEDSDWAGLLDSACAGDLGLGGIGQLTPGEYAQDPMEHSVQQEQQTPLDPSGNGERAHGFSQTQEYQASDMDLDLGFDVATILASEDPSWQSDDDWVTFLNSMLTGEDSLDDMGQLSTSLLQQDSADSIMQDHPYAAFGQTEQNLDLEAFLMPH
ncbi:hypothetical protein Z043_117100 [Scleropages formosus]|uniref:Fork-head domain-containing protein n=1 Tax=Scleropages formosus TaxID=113540 RepID=A0A0P7URF6_SCLFO|nr:forkhead box protein J1-A-like isoform X2 [Scleropages formosus]KPP64544.1 hypothetical protein Z043_117100 [Scleropages formosus]